MRYIFLLITILFFTQSFSQSVIPQGSPTTLNWHKGGVKIDSTLIIPVRDTSLWLATYGNLTIRPQDGKLWYRSNNAWKIVEGGGSTTDTTSLSNRINQKQNQLSGLGFVKINGTTITYDNSNYTPTNRVLTINGISYDLSSDRSWTIPTGGDTTSLSNRIDQKQNQLIGNGFVKAYGGVVSYDPNTYLTSEVDGDPLNEIQTLSGTGSTITLSKSGGSYTIPPPDLTNYVQFSDTISTIATKSDVATVSGGAIQNLNNTRLGNQINLGISAGGTGTSFSVADGDTSSINEIQTLGRTGNQITLTNGGSVVDSSKTYLQGSGISILGSYPNYTINVDTNSIFQNKVNYSDSITTYVTPSQLSNSVGNGTVTLNTTGIITGGTSFNLNQSTPTTTTFNVPGTNLGNSVSGTNRTITTSTGTSTTFSIADNDNSATNEIQSLSLSGNNLTISSGNTVALPIPNVDSFIYQTVYRTDTMRTNIYNAIDGAGTVGSTSIFKNGNSYEREALSGDVTATRNSNVTTISNNAVTNVKAADMAASTIKGRASGAGTGDPQDLTATQVRTILNVADGANNYVHPNSGVTPGTYNNVTVNLQGHVTTGTLEPYLSKNDSNTVFITPKQLTDSLNGRVGNYLQFNDTLATIATKSDIISASGGTIQSLSNTKSGNNIALAISGGGAGTNFSVADADSSTTNELQTVSRSGQTITLSNSGGSFVDSFSRYAAGTNVTITGTYPAYTINATQPSLTNYMQYSDTNTVISTKKNLADTASALRTLINTKENAFSKGSIIAGTNITTSGTLTNRLVGAGDVTINAVVPSLTGYIQYSDTLTRIATRSYVDTAKVNIRAQKEDAFSKGTLVQGTNAILTGTLTNRLVGTGNVTIDANLSTAVKYTDTNTVISTKKNLADTSAALRTLIGTKQNQLNGTGFVKATGTTITYDNSTYVPTSRTITINGNTQDLSANRTWTIPTIDTTSLSNRINLKQNYSDTLTYDATKTWVEGKGYLITEVDGSVTNEIQTLGRSGSNITLSLGGGSVIDSSRNYAAGSNVTITGTYPNYTVNAIQPSLTGYVQFSDTLTRIATRSYIDTAKINIRNEKENTFLKGNVVAGTGVTLSGVTSGRLVGTGNLTINATPTDLSGVVKYVDTNTVIATKKNLADTSSTLRVLINGKEDAFSKGNIVAGSNVTISGTLTNRLVGSGNITINASAIDTTSLSNRINQKIDTAQKAQPNGVATLGGDGKVPTSQLPDAILGAVIYQGTYSVVTNTPTLPTATGNKGKYYVVTDSGLYVPNSTVYRQGDWIISNGVVWQKVDNNNNVTSVNGQVGAVTITETDPVWTAAIPTVMQRKGSVPNSSDMNTIGGSDMYTGGILSGAAAATMVNLPSTEAGVITNWNLGSTTVGRQEYFTSSGRHYSRYKNNTGTGMTSWREYAYLTDIVATNLAIGTRTSTTMPITNSNGTGVTLLEATTSLAGLLTATDKTKLDGLSNYTLPIASSTILGGIKVGSGLSIAGDGTLSSTGSVTNFTSGNLSPLFTTSVATSSTTPALSFSLTNSTANTWFGNATGSTAAPSYNSLGALTKTDDANVTLTLGGTPATALAKSVSLTLGWTGQLSVARGGSGASTLTGYLKGNGTSPFTAVSTIPWSDISGVPSLSTNIGSGKSGTIVTLTSSTGTGTSFSVADADSSATNELQTISGSGNTITLSNGGGSYSIPSAAGTNIGSSRTSNNVTLTSSTGTGTVINVADADSSITNELQTIAKVGSTVTLSNGGGSFTDDNTTYSAGTGISFAGTVINNTGDLSTTNEIQNLSLGTATATTQPLNISLGTGTTLPSATTAAAGLLSASDKTKLDGLTNYTLPIATASVLGGVKIGSGINVAGDGTISAATNGTVTSVTIGNGLTGTSPITNTGTITLGTPSNVTLSSTNSVTSTSHSHAFVPGGLNTQYIAGDGTLATFPTIPAAANNGILTLATSGISTGSQTFTANQATNATFTVNTPGTNLGGSLSGTTLAVTSSTGTNASIDISGLNNNFIGNGAANGSYITSETINANTAFTRSFVTYAGAASTNLPVSTGTYGGMFASYGHLSGSSLQFQQYMDRASSSGADAWWYRNTGTGSWLRVASREWANAQGWTTNTGTVTSVGLSAPSAFTVSGSPVTGSGTLTLAGAGSTAQYIRGDGTLATFPTIPTYTGSTSITLSGSAFQRAALTGDVTATLNSNATTIANNVVTYAKMQDIGTQTLIGRGASGTGDPGAVTIGLGLALSTGNVLSNTGVLTDKWGVNSNNYIARNSLTTTANGFSTGADNGLPGGIQTAGAMGSVPYVVQPQDHNIVFTATTTCTLPDPTQFQYRILGIKVWSGSVTVNFIGSHLPQEFAGAVTSYTGNGAYMTIQSISNPSTGTFQWIILQK